MHQVDGSSKKSFDTLIPGLFIVVGIGRGSHTPPPRNIPDNLLRCHVQGDPGQDQPRQLYKHGFDNKIAA